MKTNGTWLIRKIVETNDNQVLGPLTTEEVQVMLANGDCAPDDEICQANQYWFALHEAAEIKKFLNFDSAQLKWNKEEWEKTQPDILIESPTPVSTENTAVIQVHRTKSKKSSKRSSVSPKVAEQGTVHHKAIVNKASPSTQELVRSTEHSWFEFRKLYSLLFYIGILLAVGGVYFILKKFRV